MSHVTRFATPLLALALTALVPALPAAAGPAPALLDPAASAAPVRLTPDDDALHLSWDAHPGATGYRILRDGALHAVVGAERTSWTDTTSNGTAHTYAVESTGAAAAIGSMTGTALDLRAPERVGSTQTIAVDGGVIVRWDVSAEIAGDTVEYRLLIDGEVAGVKAGGMHAGWFSAGGLLDGAVSWAIAAVDQAGNTRITSGKAYLMDLEPAGVPVRVQVSSCRDGAVELRWEAFGGTGGDASATYRVWNGDALMAQTEKTSQWLTGLAPGMPAKLAVTAIDPSGNESPRSLALTVTPTLSAATARTDTPDALTALGLSAAPGPEAERIGDCFVTTPERVGPPPVPHLSTTDFDGSVPPVHRKGMVVHLSGGDSRRYAGYRLLADGQPVRSGALNPLGYANVAVPLAPGTATLEAELVDLHGQVSPRRTLFTAVRELVAPAVATDLRATRESDGGATVTWSPSSAATAYEIEVDGRHHMTTGSPSVTLPPTERPTTRTIRVRAVDAHGQPSLLSAPLIVVT